MKQAQIYGQNSLKNFSINYFAKAYQSKKTPSNEFLLDYKKPLYKCSSISCQMDLLDLIWIRKIPFGIRILSKIRIIRKHVSFSIPNCVHLCPKVLNCVQLCPTVSNCVQLCLTVSNCVQLCPTVSNCAFFTQPFGICRV